MNSTAALALRPRPLGLALCLALCLTLAAWTPVRAQEAAAPALTLGERLEAEIQERFDQGDLASLQVAVRHGDELLWSGALGYADLEHQVPAGPQTIYRIASVTKQFTAARLLQQVAEGEIGLEDDVRTELPDLPTGGHAVSVRQLLNHTSGIPSYTDLGPKWIADMGKPLRYKSMLELLADSEHGFEPGTDWAYNNTAYFAAGELVAELGRGGFRRQLERELCAPLGLGNTSLEDHAQLVPHRARGYTFIDFSDTFRNALYMHPSQPGGAGALLSNCEDLVVWEQLLMGGDVLGPELLREMTTSAVLADGREPGYGFGLSLGELRGVERWHHSGGIFGASSFLAGYPEADLAIALITNTGDKGLGLLELELAEIVLEELGFAAPIPEPGAALSEAEAAPYLGRYLFNGLEGLLEWSPERGLVAKFQGERRFELRPTAEHELRVVGNPAGPGDQPAAFTDEEAERLDVTLRFHRFEDGCATRCTLVQRGGRQTGVRVEDIDHGPQVRATLADLSLAVEQYVALESGEFPASLGDLLAPPSGAPPLIKGSSVPEDPWGRAYRYDPPTDEQGYRIYTLGRDGVEGGENDDADIEQRQRGSIQLAPSPESDAAARVTSDLVALSNAIDNYAIENAGKYPESLQELLSSPDGDRPLLRGNRIPTDPWGVEYAYDPPTAEHGYRVYTLGRDGREGGDGPNADRDHLEHRRASKVRADISALCNAIDMYAIENAGHHPESLQELVAPDDGGASYLKGARVPTDPWGVVYAYEPPTVQAPYRVFTLGKDGREGGEGEDADVSNRDD